MFYVAPVLLSLCVVQVVMAAVLLTFWRMRVGAPGLLEMAAAMAISSFGAVLTGTGISNGNLYFAFAGIQCFVIAFLMAARAMRRLQGLPSLRALEAAVIVCCAVGDAYFMFVSKNLSGVAVLHSAAYTVICAITAHTLFREPSAALKPGCRILGFMFGAFAAGSLIRAATRLFVDMPVPVNMQIASLELAYVFFGIAVSIGWSLGFVWTSYSVAEYRLRAVNEKLERFSGAVAHDLNTPLNAIIGYLDAITHAPDMDDKSKTQFVATAREAALRMNRFIHDLLEQSRDGHEDRAPQAVDAARCIDDALKPLQPRIDAVTAKVHVAVKHGVMATPFQITRVFQNLLDNAIKYRADIRPLEIHISSIEENGWVSLSVRDNGLGVSSTDQSRIFGQFERAEGNGTIPGYGMGLAECRNIIESFGGSIGVQSEPGYGSTFVLRLPSAAV